MKTSTDVRRNVELVSVAIRQRVDEEDERGILTSNELSMLSCVYFVHTVFLRLSRSDAIDAVTY